MRVESFSKATGWLLAGLDVLLGGLVVLAVALATRQGSSPWLLASLGGVFLVLYAVGRVSLKTTLKPLDDPRARLWPEGVWVMALIGAWLALLSYSPVALWVAFPLMLVALHVLGPRFGIAATMAITGIAIGHGLRTGTHGWASLGSVLGPIVGAGVAIAVVLGLEALAREIDQRQALVDELTATRTELADVEAEKAVFGERERLAREIHDTLAQGFSAIDLLLRATSGQVSGPAVGLIDQAGRTARENLAEARRFVRALAPVDLDTGTLADALQRTCERAVAQRPGLAVTFEVDGTPRRLGVDAEAALLRIGQSALANVVQHSDAAGANVRLGYSSDGVTMRVTDDGRGFDTSVPGTGYGLRGMASRARQLGGGVVVESASGEGTTITATLPISEEKP